MVDESNVVKIRKTKAEKNAPEQPGWMNLLLLNGRGEPERCLNNAIVALSFAPEWNGVLAFNEFSISTVCLKQPPLIGIYADWHDDRPQPWTDAHDLRTAQWLQMQGIMVGDGEAAKAVQAVAHSMKFHPVREYLSSVEWDRKPRLQSWTSRYLGVEPSDYADAVGIRWMISAVARIFEPGCKADCALILMGEQGIRKSTALKILGGDWFTDQLADMGSKDSCIDVQGAWIVELAELDSMGKASVSSVKAFMSRTTDRFRPPFGRRTAEFPRQCVFAGTVNPEGGFLKDATGARRFWPILCNAIDTDDLEHDRDQLWAEAVHLYRQGFPWWLDTSELNEAAAAEQAECYQGDVWDDLVNDYIFHKNSVTISEILTNACSVPVSQQTRQHQMRVGGVLTSLGWRKNRVRGPDGKREYGYQRP